MPWPDDFTGLEPPPDPFAPPPDVFTPPQEWRDLVASEPVEPEVPAVSAPVPLAPTPNPLGFTPTAEAGVDAAFAPPAEPAPPQFDPAAFQFADAFGGDPAEPAAVPFVHEQTAAPTGTTLWREDRHAATAPGYDPRADYRDPSYNPLKDPSLDEESKGRALAALERVDPERYALISAEHALEAEEYTRGRARAAARQAADEQERIAKLRVEAANRAREATMRLDADATKLAAEKVDPERWWNNRSTPQKIAGFLAAIVGGLVQAKTGGPNSGLAMIESAIEQDIKAQQANLSHRRDMLGARRQSIADQQKGDEAAADAADTFRVAAYTRVMNELETERQQYNESGTRALGISRLLGDIGARRAQALTAFEEKQYKRAKDAAEFDLKVRTQEEQSLARKAAQDQAKATQALGWSRLAFDKSKHADDTVLKREEIAAKKDEKAQERADKQAERVSKFGMYGPNVVELDDKGSVKIVDGKPAIKRGPALIQADGQTQFTIEDSAARKEAIEAVDSAERLTAVIDEIVAIRDRVGGESTILNSDDAQRLKVLGNEIVLLKKKGTQGMSSDADLARIEESLGAKDVTSFRARAAGLEKARELVNQNINSKLNKYGYSGPPLRFENAQQTVAPEKTWAEEKQQRLFEKPNISIDDAMSQSLRILRENTPRDSDDGNTWKTATQTEMVREAKRRSEEYKDIAPDQRAELLRLGRLAAGSTPAAASARAALIDVASRGGTERIREEAQSLVDSANRAAVLSGEPLDIRSASVAQESP